MFANQIHSIVTLTVCKCARGTKERYIYHLEFVRAFILSVAYHMDELGFGEAQALTKWIKWFTVTIAVRRIQGHTGCGLLVWLLVWLLFCDASLLLYLRG